MPAQKSGNLPQRVMTNHNSVDLLRLSDGRVDNFIGLFIHVSHYSPSDHRSPLAGPDAAMVLLIKVALIAKRLSDMYKHYFIDFQRKIYGRKFKNFTESFIS